MTPSLLPTAASGIPSAASDLDSATQPTPETRLRELVREGRELFHGLRQEPNRISGCLGRFHAWMTSARRACDQGLIDAQDVRTFLTHEFPGCLDDTLQGLALRKPHGHAGDFEIIDRIHTGHVTADPRHRWWDQLWQANPSAVAVRNRKRYFHQWLGRIEAEHRGANLELVNLGSGPCRDVHEWFSANPASKTRILCVDQDPEAIAFGRGLCADHGNRVDWVQANVLRFIPNHPVDLIWSAGVFDYLTDSLVVLTLRRLWRHLKPGGELVVGNFGPENPSRAYMELVAGWHLHHRSAARLFALGTEAGLPVSSLRVDREPTGVNLFLHARKP